MTNRHNVWIKNKINALRASLCCEICNSKENIEFAHIKPTSLNGHSRGRKERYYDFINNRDSYKVLCHECHKRFDHENP